MSVFVKVCGITDLRSAQAAVEAGVDAIGFVFADSVRRITPERARAISAELPGDVLRVAVFRRPSGSDIEEVIAGFQPDLIQADQGSTGRVDGPVLPVYREGENAIPLGGRFLYEAAMSGVGMSVDLGRAGAIARQGEMVLAGGLRPDSVAGVIGKVKPFGVDVSSGVETTPGVKDRSLIRAFVTAVRAAEERLVTS